MNSIPSTLMLNVAPQNHLKTYRTKHNMEQAGSQSSNDNLISFYCLVIMYYTYLMFIIYYTLHNAQCSIIHIANFYLNQSCKVQDLLKYVRLIKPIIISYLCHYDILYCSIVFSPSFFLSSALTLSMPPTKLNLLFGYNFNRRHSIILSVFQQNAILHNQLSK